MARELSLMVVGADHPNRRGPGRRFEIELCRPGEPVALRPEPTNPADPRAIAVDSARGIQIGYIQAERAQLVGTLLARHPDAIAVFQRKDSRGAVIRLNLLGEAPTLPAPAPAQQAAPDWWPDEQWQDTYD